MAICSGCGRQFEEGAVVCEHCGVPVNGAAQAQPAPAMPAVAAAQPVEPNPGTLWLWMNIIFSFFYLVFAACLCYPILCLIPGIIGIVFASLSVSKYGAGNILEAKSNAKVSKIVFFVGLAIVVAMMLVMLVVFLIYGAVIFSAILSQYNY